MATTPGHPPRGNGGYGRLKGWGGKTPSASLGRSRDNNVIVTRPHPPGVTAGGSGRASPGPRRSSDGSRSSRRPGRRGERGSLPSEWWTLYVDSLYLCGLSIRIEIGRAGLGGERRTAVGAQGGGHRPVTLRSDRPGADQTHRSRSLLHANPVTPLSPLPRGLRQITPPSLPLAV